MLLDVALQEGAAVHTLTSVPVCTDAHVRACIPLASACAAAGHQVTLTAVQDKYCGDAVCTPAIRILEEMGVLKELVDNNEANFADSGGFVSPSGLSYIGARPTPYTDRLRGLPLHSCTRSAAGAALAITHIAFPSQTCPDALRPALTFCGLLHTCTAAQARPRRDSAARPRAR